MPLLERGLNLHIEIWVQKLIILGADVPKETLIWQDPVPKNPNINLKNKDIDILKTKIAKI